jgi:hypothetical protein
MKPQKIVVDVLNNTSTVEDFTDEEILELENDTKRMQVLAEKMQELKIQEELKRQALLDKLGITEEEAKLLLS